MTAPDVKRIARLFSGRFEKSYVASKLRTDPLYAALADEIRDSQLPLLDLGCGLGLVAFYLRSLGLEMTIAGFDFDGRKIEMARHAATEFGGRNLSFTAHDLRTGVPDHRGNVCILDILQYFQPGEQAALLASACARLAPGGKLIIRSGLRDASLRYRVTHLADRFANATFWMKSAPKHYPSAEDFQDSLSPHGKLRIIPLWGKTPFNNHLIVLEKP